jgi:predicted transcriptional regulator
MGLTPTETGFVDTGEAGDYIPFMNLVRRTIELDPGTDARLREMAEERGQAEAAVLAEAVALLDSVVDISGPELQEDRRRLAEFRRRRQAVPLSDVKAWVDSWDTADERPRPEPKPVG